MSYKNLYLIERYNPALGKRSIEEFGNQVIAASKRLSIDPNWLMAVMDLETAGSFNPSIHNGIGYYGLIQFGASLAEQLSLMMEEGRTDLARYLANKIGTPVTAKQISALDAVTQLELAELELSRHKDYISSFTDLYLAVFYPKAIRQRWEKDFVFPQSVGEANPKLRATTSCDKNGSDPIITKNSIAFRLRCEYPDMPDFSFDSTADQLSNSVWKNWKKLVNPIASAQDEAKVCASPPLLPNAKGLIFNQKDCNAPLPAWKLFVNKAFKVAEGGKVNSEFLFMLLGLALVGGVTWTIAKK